MFATNLNNWHLLCLISSLSYFQISYAKTIFFGKNIDFIIQLL